MLPNGVSVLLVYSLFIGHTLSSTIAISLQGWFQGKPASFLIFFVSIFFFVVNEFCLLKPDWRSSFPLPIMGKVIF
jgi:hypothetical protein